MIKIEIFDGLWKIDDINPDKLYIYNDNNNKVGNAGLSIIRNLPNALGIRVRKGPSKKPISFWSDSEYRENINSIVFDILEIKKAAAKSQKTIVFSNLGYGRGEDKLDQLAQRTFKFLSNQLMLHFNFDNINGCRVDILPSKYDIENAHKISLDKINLSNALVQPVNIDMLRYSNMSLIDMIKSGKKISITGDIEYNSGEFILLSVGFDNLLCRVSYSYNINLIDSDYWSIFEGFKDEFIESNIDIYNMNYIQTHFTYILSINKSNRIESGNQPIVEGKSENKLSKFQFKIKNPFKRLKFQEYLKENNISGDIIKLNIHPINGKDLYSIRNSVETFYIEHKKGIFMDGIRIIGVFKN